MSMPQAGALDLIPRWPHCPCWDSCPYVCDQPICYAACRGRASAQALALEARRQTELLSQKIGRCCILCSERALDYTLAQALYDELAVMDTLCAQAQIRSL